MCARWAKHKASWRSTSPAFQAIHSTVGDRSVTCLCDAIAVTSLCPNRGGETPVSPEGAPGGQGSFSPGPPLLLQPHEKGIGMRQRHAGGEPSASSSGGYLGCSPPPFSSRSCRS